MLPLKKTNWMVILGLFLFSSAGFAGMMNGKVISSDPATRKLTLSTVNAATGQNVQSDIWVEASAGLKGVSSFSDIKPGDILWLETESDTEGNLRASTITKA